LFFNEIFRCGAQLKIDQVMQVSVLGYVWGKMYTLFLQRVGRKHRLDYCNR